MRHDVRLVLPFVLAALLVAAHVVAGDAIVRALPRLRRRGVVASVLFFAGLVSLGLAQRGSVPAGTERFLGLLGALVFCGTLGVAFVWAIAWPLREWLRHRKHSPSPSADPLPSVDPDPSAQTPVSRREFVARACAGGAVALGTSPAVFGILVQRVDYECTTVPFRIPRLDPRLEGFALVQLSDLHFGTYVGDAEARHAVEFVRGLRPDGIVITGDLVDRSTAPLPTIGRMIRALTEHSRSGVHVILGNHDVWTDAAAVLDTARRAGARTLVNEHCVIGASSAPSSGFVLGGVDDVWNLDSGGADLARTFRDADPDRARVLLCHNPELFPEAAKHADLQLSGHTHGGQVAIADVSVASFFGYERVAGRYELGASQLYVNRGFGTFGVPVRLGARPEITRIVLTRA